MKDASTHNCIHPDGDSNGTLEETLLPPTTEASPTTHASSPATAPLNTLSLSIILFYTVSGGPFGIEPAIRSGGNFAAIMGFLLGPLVFSIPEALMTAELGSAFRCPSGGVAWIEEAFGEDMGFLPGWLGWISGATDNAIYPTLFLEYLRSVPLFKEYENGDIFNGWTRFGCLVGITLPWAVLNYRGLHIVGNTTLLVCIISMSPFIPMTIMGIPKIVPSNWLKMPDSGATSEDLFDDDYETSSGPFSSNGFGTMGGILWRPFLNNLFWCLNSYDSAANFATETDCVKKTYTRGIFFCLVITFFSYIIPLLVATGATDYSQSEWVDGQLGAAAFDIGGAWLGAWMLFAAGISSLGMFEAEMSSDALMLMGMAERGYLPGVFKNRFKFGTPTSGIITGTIVIICFGWADFGQLLEFLNVNYALALLLEYAAFVKLRHSRKDLERPYRIPVYDRAAFLIVIPPTLAIFFVILVSNWYTYLFSGISIVAGLTVVKVGKKANPFGGPLDQGNDSLSTSTFSSTLYFNPMADTS